MVSTLALLASFLFTNSICGANPYILHLVADEQSVQRALELRRTLRKIDPLSRLSTSEFQIKVTRLDSKTMGCKVDAQVLARSRCQDSAIQLAAERYSKPHATIALTHKQIRGYAKSDMGLAAIYASDPQSVLMHEFMHLLGFGDEYRYESKSEPDHVDECHATSLRSINSAVFEPLPHYSSSIEARKTHSLQIPWISQIAEKTPLVFNGELETSTNIWNAMVPGLYPGGSCGSVRTVWRPFPVTIMMAHTSGVIPPLYKKWILEEMARKRGEPFHLVRPVDFDCLGKWTSDMAEHLPELAKFTKPLDDRFKQIESPNLKTISAGFLRTFPEFDKTLTELERRIPECLLRLGYKRHSDGTIIVRSGHADPFSKNWPRSFSIAVESNIEGLFKRELCTAEETESAKNALEPWVKYFKSLKKTHFFRAADQRSVGHGEIGFWATLDFEADPEALGSDLLGERLTASQRAGLINMLGEELFLRYQAALRKNHFESPDFDCPVKLREYETSL